MPRDMSAVEDVGERPPRVTKPRGFRALKDFPPLEIITFVRIKNLFAHDN